MKGYFFRRLSSFLESVVRRGALHSSPPRAVMLWCTTSLTTPRSHATQSLIGQHVPGGELAACGPRDLSRRIDSREQLVLETQRRIRAYPGSELLPFTEVLMKRSARIIAALLLGVSCAAAEPQRKRLGVLDFEYGLVRKQTAAIFGTEVDVGRGMRDLILKHLVRDGTYTVVDLKALDKMLARMGRRKL